MEYLIDKLLVEGKEIINRRDDLTFNGDFSNDGERILIIELKIRDLKKLPVKLLVGQCSCNNRIERFDIINYCAWCHKEIIRDKT